MKQLLRYGYGLLLAFGLALSGTDTHAQAPAWVQVATSTQPAMVGAVASTTTAVATDASGNVFVTGYFRGTADFGGTVLTSKNGDMDIFVAKYLPATGTWAWAQRGGGTFSDAGLALAVSGNSVYVTGSINSGPTPGFTAMTFGGTNDGNSLVPLAGISYFDMVVAKYTDNGASGTLNWVQALGNTSDNNGTGIAVKGANVYVAGNSGGKWYLTKLIDTGTAATQSWTYTGGGTGYNVCTGLAINGPNLYLIGSVTNNRTNANAVTFGSDGSPAGVVVNGVKATASSDLLLLKYLDQGATATLQWAQVAGGTQDDSGRGVAVSGNSVYVTGYITNDTDNTCEVVLGGSVPQFGATFFTSDDWLLAKYTDNGASASFNWAHVAGSHHSDVAQGVAVSGNNVYVTGAMYGGPTILIAPPVFGGTGGTVGTLPLIGYGIGNKDLVVAKYADNGSSATVHWAQLGGGPQADLGLGIAVSGQSIYAGGSVMPPASFGALPVPSPLGPAINVLARLVDATLVPLATAPAGVAARPVLYPNPARGLVTLAGSMPGAAVQVLDALGRVVLSATADATGTAKLALPVRQASGVYVVRAGQQALRLTVE
jgi:hypothetical protein